MTKPGPKPKHPSEVLTSTIGVSVTAADRARYHAAAAKRGVRLAELIRIALETFLRR